tara:strand:+ start:859 stop:1248 length:390 start_codon:yes stop_codon:yes gene_type:complete
MNISKANEIIMAVQEGTAKEKGFTAQEIKDAKARMAQFNKNTKNDMMPGKARTNFKDGGAAKKKVPAISISVGMVEVPKNGKNKAKMMKGGMANGKPHMYLSNGGVVDNAGLRALKKASPEAYNKITKS